MIWRFLWYACAEIALILLPVLKLPSPSCSATTIFIKGLKLWRFDNTISEFWAYFHRARAETAIYELPVKNLTPPFAPAISVSYKTSAFPLPSDAYGIDSMFSCYYVARPCDLDLWPFDLESVSCTVLLMSDPHTYFYYIRLSVTELRVLNIWSHFRYLKQSLRMRRHLTLTGGKNSSHFWNTWPQIAYSFCHFQGARTKMKPCYRRKIAFSHYEGYKVYCACAVSRNLFIGGPPKPHVTMFSPRLIYSLYNFYWATMTIRGSLYWSIPMLKLFSVAKNEVPSNIGPRNGGFFKFKGPNIKYSHRDPKRHLLARNDVIWRILRKYPSRCVGCSLIEGPQKKRAKN